MSKVTWFAKAAVGGLMLMVAAMGMARAEQVTLRYSNWLPPTYFVMTEIIQPWMKDVERVTEGRVKFDVLPKVVGTVPGQYDVVRDGLADVSMLTPSLQPNRFPLISGMELPFLGDSALTRSPASWRAYETHLVPTGIFEDVVVVGLFAGNTAHIVTSTKEIKSAADVSGLKLRVPSPTVSEMVTLLGGTPISKPFTEIYELATSGVIDGGVIPPETMPAFKLEGALKQVSQVPGGMANTINIVAINKDKWNTISEPDRAAILEVSGEKLAVLSGQVHQKNTDTVRKVLEGAGVKFTTVDEAGTESIKAALEPIRGKWIESAKEAGLSNPDEFLQFLEAEIAGN
jgi:TRAP-type C4-dicarboxylate transport system substrate-binding protein